MVTRAIAPRRRVLARPQRKRVWARQLGSFTGVTQALAQDLSLTGQFETDYGADLVGATVARTHVSLSAVTTAGTSAVAGLAVGILMRPAPIATAVAPLDPEFRHADWSYVRVFWGDPGAAGTAEQLVADIDLKSMRKMDEIGMTYELVVQSATSGSTWDVQFHANTLLLLP